MKNTLFKGIATAMVTPMTAQGIDFDALARLIEFQIENGINALIPTGTTGESATLSPEERKEVIRFTLRQVDGRVPVIAGTGTNDTRFVLDFTRFACDEGADGVLVVTPYYNKSTQGGLIAHYTAVADASDKPVILYNVPGRAGREIPLDVVVRLAAHPNVVAIKEAAGSVERVSAIKRRCPDFTVLSGDDSLVLPMVSVGASGVISVASDVIPKEMSDFVRTALAGDMAKARELHLKYYQLFHDLFIDTNPIMVKEALALMGKIDLAYRLPLCETTEANRARMAETLKELGII